MAKYDLYGGKIWMQGDYSHLTTPPVPTLVYVCIYMHKHNFGQRNYFKSASHIYSIGGREGRRGTLYTLCAVNESA